MVSSEKMWEIIQSKANISGTWRQWWSVNTSFSDELVFIVVYETFWGYNVHIVVFDKPMRWGYGNLQVFRVSEHWTLSGAKDKAETMESRLKNIEYDHEFPIVGFLNDRHFDGVDVYDDKGDAAGSTLYQSTWVHDLSLSIGEADEYLRPFDVIKADRSGGWFKHVAIYLGNGYICHFSGDKRGSSGSGGMKVIKDTLNNFFLGEKKESIRIVRPIFKFKSKQRIIEDIAKAIVSEYGKYQYDVKKNNCEHFANMIVLGISYSGQARSLKPFSRGNVLKEEIKECGWSLNNLVSSSSNLRVQNLINEIRELAQESSQESYGNWEARIEARSTCLDNAWCKIQ